MNTFRTVVPPSVFPIKISHKSRILLVGSCFTEHIGGFFRDYKFNTLINPFGISYNPKSISNTLNRLITNTPVSKADLVLNNDRYCHWEFHGVFSDEHANEMVDKLNTTIFEGHNFLKETEVLFITLGTAYAFRHIESGHVVANCHKFPNEDFERELLDQKNIYGDLRESIERLQDFYPNLKIVFTISPVRHIRDGLVENQHSKAQLITATHKLVAEFDHVFYFPSYELIMDDLRDYRYYKSDMIHVSDLALDYVWDYCQNSFLDPKTIELNKVIRNINRDCAHRAIHPESNSHQDFLSGLATRIEDLQSKNPQLDFSNELDNIKAQLTS